MGIYDMTLTIEGKTFVHPVVVMRDLNEDFILGEDFIEPNQLFHNPIRHTYRWGEPYGWNQGYLKTRKQVKLSALSVTPVPVKLFTESGTIAGSNFTVVASIGHHTNPLLTGGPYMIQGDDSGQTSVLVHICSPVNVVLARGELMGVIDNVNECEYVEVKSEYISSIAQQLKPSVPISKEKEQICQQS